MNSERWDRVARIYEAVLEREPSTRNAFLAEACGHDPELRHEVESLLAHDDAPLLVDRPMPEAAAAFLESGPRLTTGTTLGPYRIDGPLGAGGMGEVYRAHDTKLHRDVALKVLPETFTRDRDRIARFLREAHVLASLNHPNIAAIHGLEDSGHIHALVLELVEGPTLADRIASGPLPLEETLGIGRQIADALATAHEHGIVHRDLKPANIKLRDDGTVKVLDFGLAKPVSTSAESAAPGGAPIAALSHSPTVVSPAVTVGGVILGTAAYMSPEQAKGKPADKRSDIWAFGCVLYEMLTGKRAFEGEDVSDTLAAVLRGEPDWNALPSDVSPAMRALIRRCLAKERKQRVGDVAAVQLVLGEPAFLTPVAAARPVPEPRPRWRRALPAGLAVIVATAALTSAVWVTMRPAVAPPRVTRFTFTLPDGQTFTNTGRHGIALSADGSQMVYVASQQLYLRSMQEVDAQPIRGTQSRAVNTPVFAPDGLSVAFFSEGAIKRVPTAGGTPIRICETGGNIFGMSWQGDTIVIGEGNRGIVRVSANGGAPERVVTVKEGELAHGPQLLPGGEAVLFTLATGTGEDRWDTAKIVVQTLGSGERKTLVDGGADARYLPPGHLVYARSGVLFAERFDPSRLEVIGPPVPIVEGVRRAQIPAQNTGVAHFSVSTEGSLVYIPGPVSAASAPRDLAFIDRQGVIENLNLPARPYEYPRLSADGTRVAVGTDDGKEAIVWIQELTGTRSTRRLTLRGNNRFPIWTPNGERVAFQSDREGDRGIYWQRADGSAAAERLTRAKPGEAHVPTSWSPDGQRLLFSALSGSGASGWILSLRDKTTMPLGGSLPYGLPNASFSPDGRWVGYASREGTSRGVFVEPFPSTGAKYQVSGDVPNATYPFWSRDGKNIVFLEPGGGVFYAVSIVREPRIAIGNPTPLFEQVVLAPPGGGRAPGNWDFAPDGRLLGVVSGENAHPQIRVVLNWQEELKRLVPAR